MHTCIRAWCDLSTERPIGMAVGAIPWRSMIAWAEHHRMDYEATDLLVATLRHVDNEQAEARAKNAAIDKAFGKG